MHTKSMNAESLKVLSGLFDSPDLADLVSKPANNTTKDSASESTLRLIGSTRFEPRTDIKNILITGGAGFVGGWVTRHLTLQYPEYNITCFDKLDQVSSLANIQPLIGLSNFRFEHGNLLDAGAVARVLRERDIDCVLHFAACSHVQNSFEDPSSFTLNNVVATQRLLDAVRDLGPGRIRRFLHVSTDEVYGDAVGDFVNEHTQFMPTNPYAASKAAAEMYVWAYAQSFDIPVIVVRANNFYGPGQYPEKIIPRFFTLLVKNQPLTIQGSGLNVRRYLYGADAADGFDTVLHRGILGQAYNISSADDVTNLEVAVSMLELCGFAPQRDFARCLVWIADRPFNDHDYRIDGSKLAGLGWRQRVSFAQGLRETVEWYRQNLQSWWPHVLDEVSAESTATVPTPVGTDDSKGEGENRVVEAVLHEPEFAKTPVNSVLLSNGVLPSSQAEIHKVTLTA